MRFEEFSLDSAVLDSLHDMNYLEATDIQQETIPIILDHHDMIALAETGSGKTAACMIPICHHIDPAPTHIQTLIIVPTRELALQYSTEAQKIGKLKGVKVFALFGGEDMDLQKAKLRSGVHILVATPGRLIDFVFSRLINLTHVKILVLDEADQMLSMGFIEDLEFIINCLVHDHQTLLFSATMPKGIRQIAAQHMKTPKEICLIKKNPIPENLSHQYYFCPNPRQKTEDLIALLKKVNPSQCLIFTNSRREVEDLSRKLKRIFPSTDFLHGGLPQPVRTVVTGKFYKQKIRYLVATDVASRGLDFSGVTHVIQYHLPRDQETYLHRSGRTGRQGREGASIALITRRDLGDLKKLLVTIGRKPIWINQPPS